MATIRATGCPASADWHQSGASRRDPVSGFFAGNPFAEDPEDSGSDPSPVIPHATPIVDAEGRLTYVGSDGLRYVVAEPPQDA